GPEGGGDAWTPRGAARGPDDVRRGYAGVAASARGPARSDAAVRAGSSSRAQVQIQNVTTTSSVSTSLTWWARTYKRASIVHRGITTSTTSSAGETRVYAQSSAARARAIPVAVPVCPDGKLWSGTSPDCRMW